MTLMNKDNKNCCCDYTPCLEGGNYVCNEGTAIDPSTGLPIMGGGQGVDPFTGMPIMGGGQGVDPFTGLPIMGSMDYSTPNSMGGLTGTGGEDGTNDKTPCVDKLFGDLSCNCKKELIGEIDSKNIGPSIVGGERKKVTADPCWHCELIQEAWWSSTPSYVWIFTPTRDLYAGSDWPEDSNGQPITWKGPDKDPWLHGAKFETLEECQSAGQTAAQQFIIDWNNNRDPGVHEEMQSFPPCCEEGENAPCAKGNPCMNGNWCGTFGIRSEISQTVETSDCFETESGEPCEAQVCETSKTFKIKKGHTYVIEVDSDSVDALDHKDHWWEIEFFKGVTGSPLWDQSVSTTSITNLSCDPEEEEEETQKKWGCAKSALNLEPGVEETTYHGTGDISSRSVHLGLSNGKTRSCIETWVGNVTTDPIPTEAIWATLQECKDHLLKEGKCPGEEEENFDPNKVYTGYRIDVYNPGGIWASSPSSTNPLANGSCMFSYGLKKHCFYDSDGLLSNGYSTGGYENGGDIIKIDNDWILTHIEGNAFQECVGCSENNSCTNRTAVEKIENLPIAVSTCGKNLASSTTNCTCSSGASTGSGTRSASFATNLSNSAAAGTTEINVTNQAGINAGDLLIIGSGDDSEIVTVTGLGSLKISPTMKDHGKDASVIRPEQPSIGEDQQKVFILCKDPWNVPHMLTRVSAKEDPNGDSLGWAGWGVKFVGVSGKAKEKHGEFPFDTSVVVYPKWEKYFDDGIAIEGPATWNIDLDKEKLGKYWADNFGNGIDGSVIKGIVSLYSGDYRIEMIPGNGEVYRNWNTGEIETAPTTPFLPDDSGGQVHPKWLAEETLKLSVGNRGVGLKGFGVGNLTPKEGHYFGTGITPHESQGACCVPGNPCWSTDEETCLNAAGTWKGQGSECIGGTCPDDILEQYPPDPEGCNFTGDYWEKLKDATSDPEKKFTTVTITFSFMNPETQIIDARGDGAIRDGMNFKGPFINRKEFVAVCEKAFQDWKGVIEYLYPWVTLDFVNLGNEVLHLDPVVGADQKSGDYKITGKPGTMGDIRIGMYSPGKPADFLAFMTHGPSPFMDGDQLGEEGNSYGDIMFNGDFLWYPNEVPDNTPENLKAVEARRESLGYDWGFPKTAGVYGVMVHEIGHTFGLDHYDNPNKVEYHMCSMPFMSDSIAGNLSTLIWTDNINGIIPCHQDLLCIQQIYGDGFPDELESGIEPKVDKSLIKSFCSTQSSLIQGIPRSHLSQSYVWVEGELVKRAGNPHSSKSYCNGCRLRIPTDEELKQSTPPVPPVEGVGLGGTPGGSNLDLVIWEEFGWAYWQEDWVTCDGCWVRSPGSVISPGVPPNYDSVGLCR